ncbi:LpxL/LpxP family Kdo(2)-lipid IV(A) lauroyl/palmitoleoyl acyltransferase [Teredinibacter turnerae]|uniref:LpxL/LpxP family Kdo(2)-lipid IV(A) lauroyl/palmitoleoyl acyltransferase n=1 Tax=Teredinibacter turnerae TaxID=2426 RepID=UPI00036D719B|nr:LpxL/LpxP family Kdo(2)-lipid IV(A) lauroyl/palmitoleoyl acyltransferase [Teredinibacter turnerae]
MSRIPFQRRLLHPKFMVSWVGMALWWLFVQLLPLGAQFWLGNRLGDLLLKLNVSRTKIARRNIAVCFPDMDPQRQELMVRDTLRATGIGVFESGAAWFWPNFRLRRHFDVKGLEHLEHAQSTGRGVLFMGIHFTPIEIGAACVNTVTSIDGFYRPHKNAVYEYVQAVGRIWRNNKSDVIPNGDVRGIIKALRKGRAVNYAPDQDYGRRRSVFAPFFGIDAATVKAPAQLARAGNAEIVPWVTRRLENKRYEIEIYPPITAELTGDEAQDAAVINRFIEARVREVPEQYLWVHRRFKTRPEGEPSIYS